MLGLTRIDGFAVSSFDLQRKVLVKGVISGVDIAILKNVPGVDNELRMNHVVNGKKEKSVSCFILNFYVYCPVRAFVSKHLQCNHCKMFGHVSSVCRMGKREILLAFY